MQLLVSCIVSAISPLNLWAQQSQFSNQNVSYLDQGYYKVYQFTEAEIQHLTNVQLNDILMIYADRFYPFYMSMSRNYISPALEHDYPVTLIEPVFKKIAAMSESEKKEMIRGLYFGNEGIVKLNQDLYTNIRKLIGDEEIKRTGKMLADQKGVLVLQPSEILQSYQFKMGLLAQRPAPTLLDFLMSFIFKFKFYLLAGVCAFLSGVLISFAKGKRTRVL